LSVEIASLNMHVKLIDLESNTILKEKYNNNKFKILYPKYLELKLYANLKKHIKN